MTLYSINPATEEIISTYEEFTPTQIEDALAQVNEAFRGWRETNFSERANLMRAAAATLRANKERYAALITVEMGKPIVESEAEIEKCAWSCEYYADNAERF